MIDCNPPKKKEDCCTNIPATLGTSEEGQPYAPKNGMYHNMLVRYEADGAVVLYDSVGVYTILKEGNANA